MMRDRNDWISIPGYIDYLPVLTEPHPDTPQAPLPHHPKPAEFVVSDLSITPAEIDPGDEVTISVLVTNIGEETGDYTVTLGLEYGLIAFMSEEEVTLEGGESKTVPFTFTMNNEGIYTVTVDELTDSFTVKAPPKPAEFVVSDLSITPEDPEIGEEIEISFTVTNIGEEKENYQFSLLIEEPYATESVEMVGVLGAGESETVTYNLTPKNFGYYKLEVDGLTEVFSLKAPILTPAEFVFSGLYVTPQEVKPGENVMVSVIITNIGEKAGIQIIELNLDGDVVDSESITLNGGVGDSATVTLTTSSESEGLHSVEIDGLSGSFTVKLESSFWDKIPGFPYESIIIGLIAVIIIIWRARRVVEAGSALPLDGGVKGLKHG